MEYDLVFEGGGAKGMVFVGAMKEFESRGHTYKRLLGTSAGAITATMLAAGYSAREMLEALGERENEKSVFNSFLGKPGPFKKEQILKSATLQFLRNVDLPLIPDFIERRLDEAVVQWLATEPSLACSYSFLEYGGLYSADNFLAWLRRRLDTGDNQGKPRQYSGMTLAEFHQATGYELSMVASDTTAGEMLILNHNTAPQLPLVFAVRMSMSIPFLWQEVVWQPEWGQYRGRDAAGHVVVDGGILSNFPIELFLSQNPFVKGIMGEDSGAEVLGMMIDESLPITGAATAMAAQISALAQAPVVRRINNIVNTTLSARDKLVRDSVDHLVVRLPAQGYGTTEFDMTDERRSALVNAGCETMKNYLDRRALAPREAGPTSFGTREAALLEEMEQEKVDQIAMRILRE